MINLQKSLAIAVCTSFGTLGAAQIDLSSWTPLTLNYPGGQGAGNWVLQPGNTAVTQVINADPSFYLNNVNQTSYSIDGSWQVKQTGGDDDYMGFVFGYQNSANFYLFDWKQSSQGYVGTTAAEGMTIKKFTGATGDGLVDLSLQEFWENQANLGDMSVLASNHGSSEGWVDNALYNFHLDFNLDPGTIRVIVSQGATVLWDQTVMDSTFVNGQFGFFNNSQEQVEYSGFTQTGGNPGETPTGVPDGGQTLPLLGLGVALLAAARRRMASGL